MAPHAPAQRAGMYALVLVVGKAQTVISKVMRVIRRNVATMATVKTVGPGTIATVVPFTQVSTASNMSNHSKL